MKIGEIAKAAGVTASRIRFYEKRGIIPPALRGENGYRDYSPDLVGTLRYIDQAQRLGFTLREIVDVEPGTGEHPVSCTVAIELLTEKLAAVDEVIAEAKERKQRIKALIAELDKTEAL
ncbi:MAG: MerR family transcriptional regulator [Sphingomonadales bacterium]|jgi:MerR family copper efflux transcriptional regulator|nr:MerR family transcriptional regulator [Sphingomonadales bacterium]MBK9003146.1 MerR family transcriptional regulator [Sphingomonadales bacterium]MBK9268394.1 MerR family transcriptional regulator [Sphingomonadales bacterium]